MKTMSGLTSRHLRFDVRAFVGQLRKLEGSGIQGFEVTHPSALLRAKAILWFSLSDAKALTSNSRTALQELNLVDERIERDLTKFIDGAVRERISRLKEDLLLWMIGVEIVQFGSFSADIQARMRGLFDQETIEKLKWFLGSLTKSSAENEVYQKMLVARGELETIVPDKIVETVSLLSEQAHHIVRDDRVKNKLGTEGAPWKN